MSFWKYSIVRVGDMYGVCEVYPNVMGEPLWTDAITPLGDNPEELLDVLRMMIQDVERAIGDGEIHEGGDDDAS